MKPIGETYPPFLEQLALACEDNPDLNSDVKMQLSNGTSFRFGRAETIDHQWVAISEIREVNGKPYAGFASSIELRVRAIAWIGEAVETSIDQ